MGAQVIGADGTRMGSSRFEVLALWSREGRSAHFWQEVDSDEEGRLRMTLPSTWIGRAGATVEIRRWRGADHCGDSYDRARVPLGPALVAGVQDAGRVFLDEPPLVLAGTVVDEKGEPCPGVSVQAARPSSWSPMEVDCDHPEGLAVPAGLSRTTNIQGRFEIRGWAEDPRAYRILLRKPDADAPDPMWSRPEPSPFLGGETDCELVLPRSASLTGSLILGPRIRPEYVYVHVAHGLELATVEEPACRYEAQANLSPAGAFETRGLEPGRCSVRIRVHGVPGDLVRLEDMELIAGRTNADRRLQQVDLGALSRVVDITAVDARDQPIPGARAWILADDLESECGWVESWESGTVHIVTRPRPLALDLTAPGFRAVRLQGVDGDRRVQLEAGIPVRLILAPSLRRSLESLVLRLTRVGPIDGSFDDSPSGARAERGGESHCVGSEALFFADAPGTYALEWATWGGGDFPLFWPGTASPSTIAIESRSELQTFVIGVAE